MSKFRRKLLNQSLTVQKCIDRHLFSETISNAEGSTDNYYEITLAKEMSTRFAKIRDFVDYFFNQHVPVWHHFKYDGSTGYLSDKDLDELLKIIKDNTYYEAAWNFPHLTNINAPSKDLIINFESKTWEGERDSFNDLRDHFTNSTFNNITLNIKDCNFSVIQNMFRRCKAKKIKFNLLGTGNVKPVDMSGFNEFNEICTSIPNNIDYSGCTNIGYAWERDMKLSEIPSYYTVTDEESRLSTPENIIGGSARYGITFANQAFNVCRVLTKIGPVLDFRGTVPNDTTNRQPLNMTNDSNNISDVRMKNLCNGNWSFINNNWRGLSNLNNDSIKYLISNLGRQVDISFVEYRTKELSEPTYNWSNVVDGSSYSLMFNMFLPSDQYSYIRSRFLNIDSTYQVQLPSSLKMKLVWWIGNGENEHNLAHNVYTEITGDDTLHTYTNTLASDGYKYCTVELFTNDDTALTKDILHQILAGAGNTAKLYVGTNTSFNYFPSVNHELWLHYSSEMYPLPDQNTIQSAYDKGWTIKFGNYYKLTPSGSNSRILTELSPDAYNPSSTSEYPVQSTTALTAKKGRPGSNNDWYAVNDSNKHVAVAIPEGVRMVNITCKKAAGASNGSFSGIIAFVSQYNYTDTDPVERDFLYVTSDRILKYEDNLNFKALIPTGSTHIIFTTEISSKGMSYTYQFV